MHSEAAAHADFTSALRYAQCWEDADILVEALQPGPGDTIVSIASAGENTLSLLSRAPDRVIAFDLNPAQLAAMELRVAAFRELRHFELLELIGSRPSRRRRDLYLRCRTQLSSESRAFWDAHQDDVAAGIGGAGKFERYFRIFRTFVLPLVHRRKTVLSLLDHKGPEERAAFYDTRWDTRAWRSLFRVFFSEFMLGRLGRDPSFFRYAEGSVSENLLKRVRHALAVLDPSQNPYVDWILTGEHGNALPHALRSENFEAIRENLDRLEWHCKPLEALGAELEGAKMTGANLSDIFEYLSVENTRALLSMLADHSTPGARLAYWNMIVERRGSGYMPERLNPLDDLARELHQRDKAFFYRDFIVEEVIC